MIAGKTWIDVRGMALAYLLVLELQLAPAILIYPEVQSIIPAVLQRIGGFDPRRVVGAETASVRDGVPHGDRADAVREEVRR